MKLKACLAVLSVVSLCGCYAGWTGGEDLDGKARELADSARFAKYTVREDPVTSPEQNAVKVTVEFYYYRQPMTISFNRYIIPGKYESPGVNQYSGYITNAKTPQEALDRAQESLLQNVLGDPLRAAVNDTLSDEMLKMHGDDAMRAQSLLKKVLQEDPQLPQDIAGWEIARYAKSASPEIEPQMLNYLIQRGILDRSVASTHYDHAVLVEINALSRAALAERINSTLNRMVQTALQQKKLAAFHEIWTEYRPGLVKKLGLNAGGLAFSDTPEALINSLKLELTKVDKVEPSIRIKASITEDGRTRPASNAAISIGGVGSRYTDSIGQVFIDKLTLLTRCLKGDLISTHIQFELLGDLRRDLTRKGLSDESLFEALEGCSLDVTFSYEGRARIIANRPSVQKTETGILFKKLKTVIVKGSLKEDNFVPVTFGRAQIRWSFFNESKRRAVDYYDETRTIRLTLRTSTSYEFEFSKQDLIEKIKKYDSSEFSIKFEGKDARGRAVIKEVSGDGGSLK
jgi:hypothetical protein